MLKPSRHIKTIAVVLFLIQFLTACAKIEKPNVLIIVLDDFGYNDLGFHTSSGTDIPPLHTPTLDSFATSAAHFSRHYTESTCSPSRAALLTGRYPARAGFTTNGRGISPETVTLPESFQAADYTTHFVGKWHTGDTTELALPHHQGFDTWFGFPNQWMLREKFDASLNNLRQPTYQDPWLQTETGEKQQYQGHLNDLIAGNAADFISRQAAETTPWFLQVSFYAPHEPVQAAPRFSALYPDTKEGAYRALVHQLDANISKLLEALDDNDIDKDTIVVIVSDNGGIAERYPSNLPFAGRKANYQEGGIRTPLMIRWLDDDLNNKSYPYAVSIMDLYPSLLEAAGVGFDSNNLDGRSILSFLKAETPIQRPLFWEMLNGDEYLFSVLSEDQRWRFSTGFLNGRSLQDLNSDSSGQTNVLADFPDVAEGLIDDYEKWHHEVHRVQTEYTEPRPNGGGILKGDSFQRSPGFGGFTFAIGIQASAAASRSVIASQADLLSIFLDESIIEVNLQDAKITAEFPTDGECHALVVTAQHNARISWILGPAPMQTPIEIFVDGQLQSSIVDHREMPKQADYTAPTFIGFWPGNNDLEFKGKLFQPLIYNHRVFEDESLGRFGADDLSNKVCDW